MRLTAAVAPLVMGTALWAVPASAESTKTTPVAGITHIHRWNVQVRGALQDYHVLLVELGNPALRFAVSKQSDRNHPTSWYGPTYGAHVAVNGSMHNTSEFTPCGATQSAGAFWTGAWSGCNASIGFGAGRASIFDNTGKLTGPWPAAASFATDGLSGNPWLIRDGKSTAPWTSPASINLRNARTVVGITSTAKTLILVTVDAGRTAAQGMTGADVLLVLSEFAAYQALYLDGTQATSLWIGKEGGLQNVPSDMGKERSVSNALMILPVAVAPPDAGPLDANADAVALSDAAPDTAVTDSMMSGFDAGSPGPEDPTGDAGEAVDASIYEGPSEGLPTGLPGAIGNDASCAAAATRQRPSMTLSIGMVLALLLARRASRGRA